MQMLDSRGEGMGQAPSQGMGAGFGGPQGGGFQQTPPPVQQPVNAPASNTQAQPVNAPVSNTQAAGFDDFDDDIPF